MNKKYIVIKTNEHIENIKCYVIEKDKITDKQLELLNKVKYSNDYTIDYKSFSDIKNDIVSYSCMNNKYGYELAKQLNKFIINNYKNN